MKILSSLKKFHRNGTRLDLKKPYFSANVLTQVLTGDELLHIFYPPKKVLYKTKQKKVREK